MTQDFKLLAGAVNVAQFAALGLRLTASGWRVQLAHQSSRAAIPILSALNGTTRLKETQNSSQHIAMNQAKTMF